MEAGGPPVAAELTAASLAKTAGILSSIKGASSSGAGGGIGGVGSGAANVTTAPQMRRIAEYRIEGSNVRGLGPLIEDINDALDQGYQININYAG